MNPTTSTQSLHALNTHLRPKEHEKQPVCLQLEVGAVIKRPAIDSLYFLKGQNPASSGRGVPAFIPWLEIAPQVILSWVRKNP